MGFDFLGFKDYTARCVNFLEMTQGVAKKLDFLSLGFTPQRLIFFQKNETKVDEKSTGQSLDTLKGWMDEAKDVTDSLREQIGQLAEESKFFISEKAKKEYDQIKTKQEKHKISAKMMNDILKFGKEHQRAASKLHGHIQGAMQQGHIDSKQGDDLFERYIRKKEYTLKDELPELEQDLLSELSSYKYVHEALKNGIENKIISKTDVEYFHRHYSKLSAGELEEKIREKMKNREDGKQVYKDMVEHEALKPKRKIKLKGNLDKFFDENSFLQAKVPERKAFIEGLEEALAHWDQQNKDYEELLDIAKEEGWISENSRKNFMKGKETGKKEDQGFDQVDMDTRQEYIDHFDSVMILRKDLRSKINEMEGGARVYMERMFELVGYSTLSKIYERDQGIQMEYVKVLNRYMEQGVIGKKTYDEYADWIEKQPLYLKKEALILLPSHNQMDRFKQLHKRLDNLTDKQKLELEQHHDEWGYTQKKEFIEWAEGQNGKEGMESVIDEGNPNLLSSVTNKSLRKGLLSGLSTLMEMGKAKFKQFATIIRRVFGGRSADPKTFDEGVAEERAVILEEDIREEKIPLPQEPSATLKMTQLELALKQKRQKYALDNDSESESLEQVEVDDEDLVEWTRAESLEDNLDALERDDEAEVSDIGGFLHVETNDDGKKKNAVFIDVNNTKAGLEAALNDANEIDQETGVTIAASIDGNTSIELKGISQRRDFAKVVEELSRKI